MIIISRIYFETYDQIKKIFRVTFCCLLDLYLTQVPKNDTKLSIKGIDVVHFLYNLHCNCRHLCFFLFAIAIHGLDLH